MSKRKTDETSSGDLKEVDAIDLRNDELKEGEIAPMVKEMVLKRVSKKGKKHAQRDVIPLIEWKVEKLSDRVKNHFCQEIDDMVHTDGPEFWSWTEELNEVLKESFDSLKNDSCINVYNQHSKLACPFCDLKDVDLESLLGHAWENSNYEDDEVVGGHNHYIMYHYLNSVKDWFKWMKLYSNDAKYVERID